MYRASINLDSSNPKDNNAYTKLIAALMQLGWKYVETSAVVIETDDITLIWQGIGLVARQNATICAPGGHLSALTFHIQQASDFNANKAYAGSANHPNALADIQAKPFP